MDIDRIRGFITLMRLPDKIALTGGGTAVAAMDKPNIEKTEFGDCVMPYSVSEPMQLALGCTFSPEICASVARAQAADSAKKGYALAGAVRGGLIRDPMSASASEFFSEDPLVTAELLKSYDMGENIGFVFTDCLGQGRFVNRTVDARALHELYLYPLIKAGKSAAALQLDGGFLNGKEVYSSRELADMFTKYIKNDAMIFTQYCKSAASDDGIAASGAYRLGQSPQNAKELTRAVINGMVMESKLNRCIERTLATMVKVHQFYKNPPSDELAAAEMPNIAIDSSVLLKNDGLLPAAGKDLTVFGDSSEFEDGSAYSLIPIKDAPKKSGALNVFLITGYEDGVDPAVANIVCGTAAEANTVVVLCGLCATPIEWESNVNAVIFCPTRPRVSEVITMIKETAPRGRLPFTWCKSKSEYPCNNKKFATRGDFRYESVYNGYRLFNNFTSSVLYPFGHGLDYTQFDINKLNVSSSGTKLHVDFVIKNIGEYAGTTVCQVYITLLNAPVYGITKRLAAFKRVSLEKTESSHVEADIDITDFAVYDEQNNAFIPVGGKYRVDVGLSSTDVRASGEVKVAAGSRVLADGEKLAPSYYALNKKFEPTAPEIEKLLKVPFIKKPEDFIELAPPLPSSIKKPLKKAEKTMPKRLLPLLRHKITTTPERNQPK